MKVPGNYALVVEDLHFEINAREILKGISLKVEKGEFVGLIGPNGAGKTTLLKCINGINPSNGAITVKGMALKEMSDKKTARQIALMHQNTEISYPFPSLDIVLMGRYPHLKRLQAESRGDYRIARKYMDYTDTLRFEKQPVTKLSGGERQRVLYAKILAQETNILLLDEPTASLDITHQEQIFKYSRELTLSGKTVVAAVHDLKIAARYCTRLILMKDGSVVSEGSPEEVLTSENLSRAYDVNALVYKNKVTGFIDFYLYKPDESRKGSRVHVIGGGGTASGVIRLLFENGFRVSAGVLFHGDSDLHCAETFGIDYLAAEPFSAICSETRERNNEKVREAELTILCNMPFGLQNLSNLEAARYAGKLIIIEDDAPENRDFTGGKALEIYNELRKGAIVTTSAQLHEVL